MCSWLDPPCRLQCEDPGLHSSFSAFSGATGAPAYPAPSPPCYPSTPALPADSDLPSSQVKYRCPRWVAFLTDTFPQNLGPCSAFKLL